MKNKVKPAISKSTGNAGISITTPKKDIGTKFSYYVDDVGIGEVVIKEDISEESRIAIAKVLKRFMEDYDKKYKDNE